MKRIVCIVLAILICVSLACPVLATDNFVPSISYKDHPEIVPGDEGYEGIIVDGNGEFVVGVKDGCLVVTPVSQAESSDKIPEEAAKELLDAYNKISNGSVEVPNDLVIRDLIDVTLLCDDVIKELEEGNKLQVTFDLGVDENTDVTVYTYEDGKLVEVTAVNNGDGTVTVTLSNTGVVAFAVPAGATKPPVDTGDANGANLALWAMMMVASAAALVVLLVSRRRIVQN